MVQYFGMNLALDFGKQVDFSVFFAVLVFCHLNPIFQMSHIFEHKLIYNCWPVVDHIITFTYYYLNFIFWFRAAYKILHYCFDLVEFISMMGIVESYFDLMEVSWVSKIFSPRNIFYFIISTAYLLANLLCNLCN